MMDWICQQCERFFRIMLLDPEEIDPDTCPFCGGGPIVADEVDDG